MATETAAEPPADAEPRGRGRPREFDPEAVLDRVVALFWSQGFEATSMSDLVEATGLNKSSLYNTFGPKEELFQTAIQRYLAMRHQMLHSMLRDGEAGLDDVEEFLVFARAQFDGEMGANGCLAVNTSTELGGRVVEVDKMSSEYRDEIRTSFRAALSRAADAGEIRAEPIDVYAEVLIAFMLSMSVFARGAATTDEVDAQFAAIRATIESWRIDR